MFKKMGFFLLAAIVLSGGAAPVSTGAAAGSPITVSAIVVVVPPPADGYCPKTVLFKGRIKASAPCTVQYRFLRSDGGVKPIKTVALTAAGEGLVEDTWTLGATTSGWEALEIISPAAYTSPHALFTLTCPPKPNITGAVQKYFGTSIPEMDISGTNFGAAQGTKNIRIDGSLITAMAGWHMEVWGDHSVSLQTGGIIPWEHVYQIAVVDGSTVISNIYNARFLYKADGVPSPSSGGAGTSFHIYIWHLPVPPGGLQLKMGSAVCPIVSWDSTGITAKVPALAPGTYDVYLQKGGDVVSFKYPFKVVLSIPPSKAKIK